MVRRPRVHASASPGRPCARPDRDRDLPGKDYLSSCAVYGENKHLFEAVRGVAELGRARRILYAPRQGVESAGGGITSTKSSPERRTLFMPWICVYLHIKDYRYFRL